MTNKQLIDSHQTCIEIIEGIMAFELRIKYKRESAESYRTMFPDLHNKYLNEIDTYKRCIKRLEQRYERILEQIKNDTNY